MGALERLENYHYGAKTKVETGGVSSEGTPSVLSNFNIATPEGAFLNLVHSKGFRMVDESGNPTELCNVLTTNGNQYIQACAGSGKALTNDMRVLTKDGWCEIGNIRVGDLVYGEDGELHSVYGVYPQGKQMVWSVCFSDGTEILCNKKHLWTVMVDGMEQTKTTGELDFLLDECSIEIPMVKPLVYQNRFKYDKEDSLLFHPYLLGLCLGYGAVIKRDTLKLMNLFPASFDRARAIIQQLAKNEWCYDTIYDIENGNITLKFQSNSMFAGLLHGLLIDGDLTHYMNGSVEVRESLITGLLESSTHIDSYGYYLTVGKLYVNTIIDILRAFGMYVEQKDDCELLVNPCDTGISGLEDVGSHSVEIVSIENFGYEDDMTCIEIDSEKHLYVTEGYLLTHNTTSLIFKIMHDIVTGETMRYQELPNGTSVRVVDKVFVGTFLKSGAEELKTRLGQWQRALGYTVTADQVVFGTLHAEFKHALNAMGVATNIGSASTISRIFRSAVSSCAITRRGEKLKSEDYKILEGVMAYYRGRLDKKRYENPNATEYELTPSIMDLLYSQFQSKKKAEGVMDFEDLQELLYQYVYVTPNQNVADFLANRYNYMYLDEFQDTSQIQYALIKAYMRDISKTAVNRKKGKLTVVGDVQQCIYSFRGSDIEVMHSMFDQDFDSTHNTLSYNYRCPENVLKPIVPSIMLNPESNGININAICSGGIFDIFGFKNKKDMLTTLEQNLQSDMDSDMSVAILCRTNYDGMIPALFLEMSGRYKFGITSEMMTLSSPLAKRLVRVTSIFTDRGTSALEDTLSMFVGYNGKWGVKQLCQVLKQNHLRIWDIPAQDLEFSCYELADYIAELKAMRTTTSDVQVLEKLYWDLREEAFSGDNQYCEGARAIIDVLLYYLSTNNFQTIAEFRDSIDELDDRLHARIRKDYAVTISTVHEFKGKERDSVYVWDDSDGVFPTNKTDIGNTEEVSEERRVHYIACTRARKKSTILCNYAYPSMFVREMDANIQLIQGKIGGKL